MQEHGDWCDMMWTAELILRMENRARIERRNASPDRRAVAAEQR